MRAGARGAMVFAGGMLVAGLAAAQGMKGAGTARRLAQRARGSEARQTPAELAPGLDAPQRLAERARGATLLLADLRDLCERIGGRPTGSPACERAVEWAVARFRGAGVDAVSTESYSIPGLWLPQSASAACVEPEPFSIRLAAAPYSHSTPGGRPIEARLVDAGDGSPAAFARLGGAAPGAVALVRSHEMESMDDVLAEHLRDPGLLKAAAKARVAALLLQSNRAGGTLYRHLMSLNGRLAPVPAAVIAREDAERLAGLARMGAVRVRLQLENGTGGAYQAENVVAEIRGREKPEEIVLLGAHLDSWDLGTGAQDNGVNDAMVIDVARGFRELGIAPRRTVRFVLFTGEEQGFWGSRGYVERHAAELDRHVAAVIFDGGSGRTTGFSLNGREELRRPVEEALRAAGGLGASEHSLEPFEGTDNFGFLLAGVPNLVANQDPGPYVPVYHAQWDVFEKVDARGARENDAIASALVWGLAESAQRPARRQTPAEVSRLLKVTKLDQAIRALGLRQAGNSGRHKAR
jgi:carboxypeptidase Q